eukprot:scaffold287_cov337-Pavlova_lutheri.AAC.203
MDRPGTSRKDTGGDEASNITHADAPPAQKNTPFHLLPRCPTIGGDHRPCWRETQVVWPCPTCRL